MPYLYDDEDQAPMAYDPWDTEHNPTVYLSRAEMKADEKGLIPFDDGKPDDGCWNCSYYNGEACMRSWKFGDPHYYEPGRDDREPEDYCKAWKHDKDAKWEVHYGNNP